MRLCPALLAAAVLCRAQYSGAVKFMTYNINAEAHGSGSYSDIAEVIKAIAPDINGLQKLDSCNTRNPAYVLQYLGEQEGMSYTFAAAQTGYGGGTGSYGIGFLSRHPPLSVRRLRIPKGSASEDRAALELGISLDGQPVRVVVTHLDFGTAANRTAQLRTLLAWMDSAGSASDPAVIMADFNAPSTESSMKVLTDAGFAFVKTAAGEILDTAQKINHILYRPESRWTTLETGNPAYPASNRYPLWARLKLQPASEGAFAARPTRPSGFSVSGRSLVLRLNAAAPVSWALYDRQGRALSSWSGMKTLPAGRHVIPISRRASGEGLALAAVRIGECLSARPIWNP